MIRTEGQRRSRVEKVFLEKFSKNKGLVRATVHDRVPRYDRFRDLGRFPILHRVPVKGGRIDPWRGGRRGEARR